MVEAVLQECQAEQKAMVLPQHVLHLSLEEKR